MNSDYFVLKECCKKFTFSWCCLDCMFFHTARERDNLEQTLKMKMKIRCFVLFPIRWLLSSEFSSVSDATLHRTYAAQPGRVVLVQEEGGDLFPTAVIFTK